MDTDKSVVIVGEEGWVELGEGMGEINGNGEK